ncbi:MAG: NnrS family protein [Burkholderiaceae bacterium]
MSLMIIEESMPRRSVPQSDIPPLLRLGFRPFYLLAAAFAFISVPVWLAKYYGHASVLSRVNLNWHIHEMVFGFAIAVIIGFLYTAGRNWTGLWTPRRKMLAGLAGLWIAGRLAMLFADPWLAAIIDISFLPLATWLLYGVLKKSANKRNMVMVALLSLLTLTNILFHAANLGWAGVSSIHAIHVAILIIVVLEAVIGGRVIPMFTANAVPHAHPVINVRRDKVIAGFTIAACAAWAFGLPAPMTASLALAAAVSQTTRLIAWQPLCTVRNPLLWILHLSYAWIPLGFVLLALSTFGIVSTSAGIHALAIGAMAGMIIGMITRTALGHTGRPLRAGHSETWMYVLVQVGAVTRLAANFSHAELRDAALMISAACWASAFLLYVAVYAPYLLAARVDGKEG